MVVNTEQVLSDLMRLGLSEYEGRVYLSLVRKYPATAYEIAKESAVPTSKVYEVLKRLIDKEIISLIDEGKTVKYVAMNPDEFLGRHKTMTENLVEKLKTSLFDIRGRQGFSHIWNITEYDYFIHKVRKAVEGSRRSVLLSIWNEELMQIEDVLRDALRRDVRIATVHFGQPKIKIGQMYPHPIEDTIYQEKGGRGLVVVIDSREVLTGTISGKRRVEGAWSMNRGFVTLAEDYIKHDIYIMKIVRRFDRTLKTRFGNSYRKLRDIFSDEEAE
jgi:sugar-specific transcriptional regulator TrmB